MDIEVGIGVYICHCGQNIAGVVDVPKIAEHARTLNHVKIVRDYTCMCSKKGQDLIKQDIKRLAINRVVVAACSPRLHEHTFQNVLRASGLNPYLLQIANIREQCTWMHKPGPLVTEKARRLVSGAVKRVVHHSVAEELSVPVFPAVLVIGGGIAGIQAALEIGNQQHTVYLIEKEPSIGGHMAQFDRTFPTLDCSACMLTPKMNEVVRNPYIKLLAYSEVENISGYVGNFNVKIRRKARYVDEEKCINCGMCQEVCECTNNSEFDTGLSLRKAIYTPFLQALPNVPVIDRKSCNHFKEGTCQKCEECCDAEAINFKQEDTFLDLRVGAIIVATGYDSFDPTPIQEFGYGRLHNVFTSLEFERMCSPTGPTRGIIKLQDGREPKSLAVIHCVGSRDEVNHSYCSQVCCMDALKYSRLFKEKNGGDVYQIYVDMCCFGKGYEELYNQVRREGVNFIRGKLTNISSVIKGGEEKLIVTSGDTLLPDSVNVTVDMVVLCVALEPRHDSEKISRMLQLGRSKDGFFMERHPILDPVGTMSDGVFVVGCCQGPKDIPDTIAQASAATARAIKMISQGKLQTDAITASINESICSRCGICSQLCPFGAIYFDKPKQIFQINQVLCKGCNVCGAACPCGAITTLNYGSTQIMAEIEGILE